jgi:hemerythrin
MSTMPLVGWNDRYSVGIYVFDVEHMQLLVLINDLYDAMVSGVSEAAILAILTGITAFAAHHFAHEEEFFHTTGYSDGEAHRAEHRRLLEEIALFKEWCADGDVRSIAVDLSAFLTTWFTEHTMGLDRTFCVHLRKIGIR